MTEQEAKALVERLTRIWEPQGETQWSVVSSSLFQFRALLAPDARLNLNCDGPDVGSGQSFVSLQRAASISQAQSGIILVCYKRGQEARDTSPFATHWLPFFRRGCWLSGADIEASMHEKAEWVQGFSKEELGAWKLKI